MFPKAAVAGRDAALDVNITSAEAGGGGSEDCTQRARAYDRKMHSYREAIPGMSTAGISFIPWSGLAKAGPILQ